MARAIIYIVIIVAEASLSFCAYTDIFSKDCKPGLFGLADLTDCTLYYECHEITPGNWSTTRQKCLNNGNWNDDIKNCHIGPCILPGAARCPGFESNITACKVNGCEWNVDKKTCVGDAKGCQVPDVFAEYGNCRRQNSWYADGGTLCRNQKGNNAACMAKGKVIHSVNTGGAEYNNQTRMVVYKADSSEFYLDFSKLRTATKVTCSATTGQTHPHIIIKSGNGESGCVTYHSPLPGDGSYELSFLGMEPTYKAVLKRHFDIKINSVTVVPAVDWFRLATRDCVPTEIVVLFKVSNDVKELTPLGFSSPIHVHGKRIFIDFCIGTLGYSDGAGVVTSFAVIKFRDQLHCLQYKGDFKACKLDGCEFNVVLNECKQEINDCADDIFSQFGNVRRANALYANAGVLCRNTQGDSTSAVDFTVYAVNLGGEEFKLGNVTFSADSSCARIVSDPWGHRKTYWFECCAGAHGSLKKLYSNVMWADAAVPGGRVEACVSYNITSDGDAIYELSVLGMEGEPNVKAKTRSLNIKLNHVQVVFGVDWFVLGGKHCAVSQITILLKIQNCGTELLPLGFTTPIPMRLYKFSLDFCSGTMGYQIRNPIASAFSLTKLKEKGSQPAVVSSGNNAPADSKKAGVVSSGNNGPADSKKTKSAGE